MLTVQVLREACKQKVLHKVLSLVEAECDSGKRNSISGSEHSPHPAAPSPSPAHPGADGGGAECSARSPPGCSQGRIQLTDLERGLHRLLLPALGRPDVSCHLRGKSGEVGPAEAGPMPRRRGDEVTWRMRSSSRRWCSASARSRACVKRSYSSAGTRHRSRNAASARFSRQNRAVSRRCSGLQDTVTPSAPPAPGQAPQEPGLRQHQPAPFLPTHPAKCCISPACSSASPPRRPSRSTPRPQHGHHTRPSCSAGS